MMRISSIANVLQQIHAMHGNTNGTLSFLVGQIKQTQTRFPHTARNLLRENIAFVEAVDDGADDTLFQKYAPVYVMPQKKRSFNSEAIKSEVVSLIDPTKRASIYLSSSSLLPLDNLINEEGKTYSSHREFWPLLKPMQSVINLCLFYAFPPPPPPTEPARRDYRTVGSLYYNQG